VPWRPVWNRGFVKRELRGCQTWIPPRRLDLSTRAKRWVVLIGPLAINRLPRPWQPHNGGNLSLPGIGTSTIVPAALDDSPYSLISASEPEDQDADIVQLEFTVAHALNAVGRNSTISTRP